MVSGPLGGPRPNVEEALKITAVFSEDIEDPNTYETETKLVREQMVNIGEEYLVKARPLSDTDFNKSSVAAIGGLTLENIEDFDNRFSRVQQSLTPADFVELRVSAVNLNRFTDDELLVPRPLQKETRLSLTAEGTPMTIPELEQNAEGVFGDGTVRVDIMEGGGKEGVAVRVSSEYVTLYQLRRLKEVFEKALNRYSPTMGVTVGEFEPITYSEAQR